MHDGIINHSFFLLNPVKIHKENFVAMQKREKPVS